MKDCLVKMGFERQEVEQAVYQSPLSGFDDQQEHEIEFSLKGDFDLSSFDLLEQSNITLTQGDDGLKKVEYKGDLAKDTCKKLVDAIKDPKEKEQVAKNLDVEIKKREERLSPSQKGEQFTLPQLCLYFDGELDVAEPNTYLQEGWNIVDYFKPLTKDDFSLNEDGKKFKIDIGGQHKLEVGFLNKHEQLSLSGIQSNMQPNDLCRWLDKQLHAHDISSNHLLEYLRQTVKALLARDDLDMAALARGRFILERVLKDRINQARKEAQKQGFQQCLFGEDVMRVDLDQYSFTFPEVYPINQFYKGSYQFSKHYYPQVASMNNEEVECAKALDMNDNIEFWVRNIEKQPDKSFWLPTDTSKFYPDFVAKLKDGRLLVVEYKGKHLLSNDDTKQKDLIGQRWAELSNNLFLMATDKDDKGRGVFEQINGLLD